jgi:hypothetical protein
VVARRLRPPEWFTRSHSLLTHSLFVAFDIILDVPLDDLGGEDDSDNPNIPNPLERGAQSGSFNDLFSSSELIIIEEEQDVTDGAKPSKEARTSQFQRSGEMTLDKWQWDQNIDIKVSSSSVKSIDPTAFSSTAEHRSQHRPNDNSSDDDEDDDDGTKGNRSQRRSNVREHSKAQREKRKAVVIDLETAAKSLTTELNDMETQLRSNLEHSAFKKTYFHDTILAFLSAWSSGDDRIETWQSLVDRQFSEMALPLTTTRYYPPGQIVSGRRILRGLNQVIADASSFALLCSSITSRGNVPISSFTFSAEVPAKSFLVEVDTAFGAFRIFTKSAVLSGGRQEISIRGEPASPLSLRADPP